MTNETEVNQEEVPSVSVPLAILADIVNIIDMCSKRGAFEGSEMAGVGNLRNTCAGPVEQFNQAQTEAKQAAAEAPKEEPMKEAKAAKKEKVA